MKIFAFYLPQFHEIPENNEWWGKGFTEWTNVAKAKPLFPGHIQPKKPQNGYYYNLMEKETVEWQTALMKKYSVDGMIYYHYYFCGKKLLEKPAENLLRWKDIKQPFFFCWANHSWNRAWKGSREVLLEQKYGSVNDWRDHFDYLLPFFKDSRYEKVDNKPVFMIYNCSFPQKKEMLRMFNDWCCENGFSGIYVIEECMDATQDKLDAFRKNLSDYTQKIYLTEPLNSKLYFEASRSFISHCVRRIQYKLNQKGVIKHLLIYNGNELFNQMLRCVPVDKDLIQGVFFEWDNTPRHGYRGHIITPPDKAVFMEYMNKIKDSEYVVVNAWNEWAEGMMIEPTEDLGDTYLSWIKEWKDTCSK